jgi:hypothetical protein
VRFFVNLSGLEQARIAVTEQDGRAVPIVIEQAHPDAEVYWVSAQSPLAPLTRYELSLAAEWRMPFDTAASSNERAPQIGPLSASVPVGTPYCEPYDAVELKLASFLDHGQPFNEGVVQVDFGEARGLFPLYALSPTRSRLVGDGDAACFGASRVPGLSADRAHRVHLTFWDSSGHGTRVEDVELTPKRMVNSGCEVGDPSTDSADATDGGTGPEPTGAPREGGARPSESGDEGVGSAGRAQATGGCQLPAKGADSSASWPLLSIVFAAQGFKRRRKGP